MPLVEVFAREEDMPKIKAAELCHFLQDHFAVEPGVGSHEGTECTTETTNTTSGETEGSAIRIRHVYLSIRAKGTPPRREKVADLLAGIGRYLDSKGLGRGKIRIELFEPSQQAAGEPWGKRPKRES
ncbi:unnamed protein product [Durusdinium trenchii]|uniref:Uncharacterized protein n=1 Tax=Durusdinium trenchii TaxID=1381693 RepID=A0ABP0SEG2_9DINO